MNSTKSVLDRLVEKACSICPGFEITDEQQPAIESLILYFSNSPEFEKTNDRSLKKGLVIAGNVGCGKTTLMRLFQTYSYRDVIRERYKIVSANVVNDYYIRGGVDYLKDYFGERGEYGYRRAAYCFDDFGAETLRVKNMGNELCVMERVILERYDKAFIEIEEGITALPFDRTFFTTNLTADQILEIYGKRATSRLREMCNWIFLPGKDKRK